MPETEWRTKLYREHQQKGKRMEKAEEKIKDRRTSDEGRLPPIHLRFYF